MLDTIKTFIGMKLLPYVVNQPKFFWCTPVYIFANENVAGYLANVEMENRRVLSVAASGDHMFESYLAGASHVDIFDINYLQRHIVELKYKMIRELPHSVFMDYFFGAHKLDRDLIAPLRSDFSDGLNLFLDTFYRTQNYDIFQYGDTQESRYDIKKISYVASARRYKRLARILRDKEINFKQVKIDKITTAFDGKYDVILLSNIYDYVTKSPQNIFSGMDYFYDKYLKPIAKTKLNDGGSVFFNYDWFVRYGPESIYDEYSWFAQYKSIQSNGRHVFTMEYVDSALRNGVCDVAFKMYRRGHEY